MDWQTMESAPKDGRKIDLLFPYPRGRQIDCQWSEMLGWHWRERTWGEGDNCGLLPEAQWKVGCYPNLAPTYWMPTPEMPQ